MQPGSVLDNRYRIERLLGKGGMGEVYKAHDLELDKTVALKCVPAELSSDNRLSSLLKKEVKHAQELRHPHICAIFDFRPSTEMPYIVMEFVDGDTLKNFIFRQEGHRCDEKAFLRLANQILAAVGHAHEAGVIHRDLKPMNVMLTHAGSVRVMDFGIAANIKETISRTTSGFVAFSPPYSSPEQIHGGQPHISMDIYSLGCTFYEMLTGEPPFTRGEILYQQLYVEPQPMEGVSKELNEAVLWCLKKDPSRRCANVAALEAKLLAEPARPKPKPVSSKRRRAPLAAAMVGVVLVAGGYGVWRWLPKKEEPVQVKHTEPPPPLKKGEVKPDPPKPDPAEEIRIRQQQAAESVRQGNEALIAFGYARAISLYRQALQLDPGNQAAANGIANADKARGAEERVAISQAQRQYDIGNYDEAIRLLDSVDSNNAEAQALRAKAAKAREAERKLKK